MIQHANTPGIHPRTFHIDPNGRLMVVAHIIELRVREGDSVSHVPMHLSVFRIGSDGTLAFVRAYDVESRCNTMWWMDMVAI